MFKREKANLTEQGHPWPRVEGPIENDWTHTTQWEWNGRRVIPGTELSIKRERGRFKFVEHVSRPNGIEWITVWGGSGNTARTAVREFRSFRPDRIRVVHRLPGLAKTEGELLAERKAAAKAARQVTAAPAPAPEPVAPKRAPKARKAVASPSTPAPASKARSVAPRAGSGTIRKAARTRTTAAEVRAANPRRSKAPATRAEVREWGRAHNWVVGQRGRLPAGLEVTFTKVTGRPVA